MVRRNRSVPKYSVPLNKSKQCPKQTMSKTVFITLLSSKKKKLKKKIELKSKKEKIVIENLKKKKL